MSPMSPLIYQMLIIEQLERLRRRAQTPSHVSRPHVVGAVGRILLRAVRA
jgi:hypothetical protein